MKKQSGMSRRNTPRPAKNGLPFAARRMAFPMTASNAVGTIHTTTAYQNPFLVNWNLSDIDALVHSRTAPERIVEPHGAFREALASAGNADIGTEPFRTLRRRATAKQYGNHHNEYFHPAIIPHFETGKIDHG